MPNTPRSGKLASTRPSALLSRFGEAYPAEDRLFFKPSSFHQLLGFYPMQALLGDIRATHHLDVFVTRS